MFRGKDYHHESQSVLQRKWNSLTEQDLEKAVAAATYPYKDLIKRISSFYFLKLASISTKRNGINRGKDEASSLQDFLLPEIFTWTFTGQMEATFPSTRYN